MMHRPSKLWPGVRRTVTVAVFLNVWNVANEFCTTIGSFFFFFFFFLFFSIDSKWKNRYSVRDILCPFLASRKINSFRLALFLYNPDPWRPRKLRLVSHELASTRILTNIIYESQRNRRRKKEIEKEWWETEEKERPVLLREPGKRKGSAAAGTVRWGGGGRLFLFTSSQVSVRRNSFSDISRFFRFFPPPSFFIEIPIAFVSLFCFFFLASTWLRKAFFFVSP